jgi:DNA modification methylase
MPTLNWASKTPPEPIPASLGTDSIVYPQGAGYPPSPGEPLPPNRLILGDNLAVMSALLPDYEGRIDLIYADPPFFTNRRYPARVGRGEDSRRPREWQLAEGYQDHWTDMDAYLDMLYPRLHMMHRLLSPNGTLYLHLDWHADAYARLLLDEIFGPGRLLNEIIWVYHGPSPIKSAFNRKHDTILSYTKSKQYTFNVDDVRQPYDPNTVKTFASSSKAGFGKVPNLKRGKVPEDWWYFPVVARMHSERTGYPTQKPEALLERIILASSNTGDLVADFFCGSGTTPLVAQRLGRQFIASDLTWRAVHTTRSRLANSSTRPFTLQREDRIPDHTQNVPPDEFLSIEGSTVTLNPEKVPELEYWEVDPAWDGKYFQSVVQAIRPRKKKAIQFKQTLPGTSLDSPVCVRWMDVSGSQSQSLIEKTS